MHNHHHIPSEWRRDTNDLANVGAAAAEADALRDAYVWFDQETDAKRTLSFTVAHGNASALAVLIRAAEVASGVMERLQSESPLIGGLALKRTAALPLSQLAAFKAQFRRRDNSTKNGRKVSPLAPARYGLAVVGPRRVLVTAGAASIGRVHSPPSSDYRSGSSLAAQGGRPLAVKSSSRPGGRLREAPGAILCHPYEMRARGSERSRRVRPGTGPGSLEKVAVLGARVWPS
eukprot:scaffold17230_cov62-Phaeocystis_antarctica.AAC.3